MHPWKFDTALNGRNPMAIVARTLGAPGVNKTPQKNRWSPGEAAGRDGSFFLPEREDRRGLFTKRGFLNKIQ